MKISNKKYIYRCSILLLVILFVIIIGYCALLFFGFLDLFMHIFGLYLIISMIFIIVHIRCMEFDNSGHVISIKQYHPFDRKIHFPVAEFPNYKLYRFEIKKRFFINVLYLEIKTQKRNIIKKYPIYGFSNKKRNGLLRSLQNLMSENHKNLFYKIS